MRIIAWVDARTRFAEWGPDSNPLIVHIKRQPGRFPLRGVLWIAFALGITATLILTWDTLQTTRAELAFVEVLLIMVGGGLFVFMPFIAAGWAAMLTRRATLPLNYDVIWATPLPNEALIWAHVFATLYRLRLLIATQIVLIPVLALEAFRVIMVINAQFYRYAVQSPGYWELVGPSMFALLGSVGLLGLMFLGVTVGVHMALLRDNTTMAVMTSILAVLGMGMCPCSCCIFGRGLAWPSSEYGAWFLIFFVAAIIIVLPYLFAIGVMHATAAQWER